MLTFSAEDVTAACRRSGVAGAPVCVHASLRSFGWITGGGAAVVRGIVAANCTLIAPTFSWSAYAIGPPSHLRPPRNGWDYGALSRRAVMGMGHKRIYTPASAAIDGEMGAVPAALAAEPNRVRGAHPLCSFAGLGPAAAKLIATQRAEDVFAPLRALAAAGGFVVLMGVGLKRMTLLHEAEKQAGRTLFRRWAYDAEGEPALFEVGGCSEGFDRLAPALIACEKRITVGRSVWRIYPAQAVLDLCVPLIRAQPEITRCADPLCTRCRDAIAGGPQV